MGGGGGVESGGSSPPPSRLPAPSVSQTHEALETEREGEREGGRERGREGEREREGGWERESSTFCHVSCYRVLTLFC